MSIKAIVFGGSGAIGAAIADRLAEDGIEVLTPTHDQCDFSKADSVEKFLGLIDFIPNHLVFAHGINIPRPIDHQNLPNIEEAMNVNFLSIARIATFFASDQSSLSYASNVVISSLYADQSRTGRSSYSSSKAAVESFFRSLATEFGPLGVRFNIVRPGFIMTPLTRSNNSNSQIELLISRIPLKRLGHPSEIASAVRFLLSKEANYINGSILTVDGGYDAQS